MIYKGRKIDDTEERIYLKKRDPGEGEGMRSNGATGFREADRHSSMGKVRQATWGPMEEGQ